MGKDKDQHNKQSIEINELLGYGEYVDSAGRMWHVKAFRLKEFEIFQNALSMLYYNFEAFEFTPLIYSYFLAKNPYIYQLCLQSPKPTVKVRLRRLLGWSDFTKKEIADGLPGVDALPLMDAIVHYNLNKSLHEYCMGIQEAVKKNRKKMRIKKKPDASVAK